MKTAAPKPLTIGLVARRAGVGVETVRFYERQGLIEEPPRRLSGYREYDDEVVARLGFIRRAKELGFTLKEIKELLSLRRGPPHQMPRRSSGLHSRRNSSETTLRYGPQNSRLLTVSSRSAGP